MSAHSSLRGSPPAGLEPLSEQFAARLNLNDSSDSDSQDSSDQLKSSSEKDPGFAELGYKERIGPDGHYVVLRKLGQGVSSTIWLAWDKSSRAS